MVPEVDSGVCERVRWRLSVLCAQSIPQRRGAAVCFVHQLMRWSIS